MTVRDLCTESEVGVDPDDTEPRWIWPLDVDVHCSGHGEIWSELESRHRRAGTGSAGRVLVEQIRENFCIGCPVLLSCARWAQEIGYTGLAAGFPYSEGERQESTWVPRESHNPSRSRRSRRRESRL